MFRRLSTAAVLVTAGFALQPALAATVPLTWLDQGPTLFGNSVPNNSVFSHPGLGNVQVTYAFAGTFNDARFNNPLLNNGNVTSGPNTYTWGPQELFAATCLAGTAGTFTGQWSITYTFNGVKPAGSVYLGVAGLGRTTNNGGVWSVASVNQNGTFLGDWSGGGNYGPTEWNPGAGTFWLRNTLAGPGGADPWWNTPLAVIRIDDAVSSLTVHFDQLPGDGVGVNIAAVPAPTGAAVLGLSGLLAMRRRR